MKCNKEKPIEFIMGILGALAFIFIGILIGKMV
jgi:hypothetical protein